MDDFIGLIRDKLNGIKGIASIGISDIAANAISALFWFYIATILGTEDYGKISYFLAVGSIASTVSLFGSANMLSVYPAKNVKIESTLYFVTICGGIISALVVFFLFRTTEISFYVIGAVVLGLSSSEILGKKLYKSYPKYLLTQKILMVVFALGLNYLIGSQGIILGIAISFLVYSIRIYKGFKETKLDFSLLKQRMGFMINSYVFNLSLAFNGSIDKLVIAPVLGYSVLGNYHLGLQFLSILQIIPSIAYKYLLPYDAAGKPNKNLKKATILISVLLAFFGFIIGPVFIPTIFPEFTDAKTIIQIISFAIIPYSISVIYESKFLGMEKSKVVLIGSLIFIFTEIVLIILLGKLFEISGIAVALVIATTAQCVFYLGANSLRMRVK